MKSTNNQFELVDKVTVCTNSNRTSRPGEYNYVDLFSTQQDNPRFLLLGISEGIGPFANYGRPGTEHAFSAFMAFFLSMPVGLTSVDLIGNIVFVGSFPETVESAGALVEELDLFVEDVLTHCVLPGQIPILIGGGHNNALPAMRWAKKTRELTSVLNLDAHFDCRSIQFRHSGNAFSKAILERTLPTYCVLGVDEYAMNEFIKRFVQENSIAFVPYIAYLQGRDLSTDVNAFLQHQPMSGLEIDLDCLEHMPSSAQSPSGFSLSQIRKTLLQLKNPSIAYLHLCEGASNNAVEERTVGKTLCYLVLDFMKVME